MNSSVLYLGCPPAERAEIEKLLWSAELSIVWADHADSALTELQRRDMPVLLDLSRGEAALEVARALRERRPETLLFAVADIQRPDLTTEAVLAGVADVFARPPDPGRVVGAITREKSDQSSDADVAAEPLYSESPSMRGVMALVARAATLGTGVVIRGEDGTGRRTVARAIHEAAHGAPAAFVSVDCSAYESDALEAALFGAAVRANHGAASSRAHQQIHRDSLVHQALGGTLYLKHVAEASTRVQDRLARLLHDRKAILGNGKGAAIDVAIRPVAAVDQSIDAAVHEGRVRPELFRCVSATRIDLPLLRNRREDIPALANYFLRDICAARRLAPKTLSRPALSLIAALQWHGNAAELRTMLENVVATLSGGKGIGLEDVLVHARLDSGSGPSAQRGTLRQARARFEREYIAHVLEQHHGRISEAAKALGIQRTNLYRKMRSLRVPRERE